MTCRVFGPPVRSLQEEEAGLAVCELCFTAATDEEIAAAEMQPPHEEEQALLASLQATGAMPAGDTVVAWCLVTAS